MPTFPAKFRLPSLLQVAAAFYLLTYDIRSLTTRAFDPQLLLYVSWKLRDADDVWQRMNHIQFQVHAYLVLFTLLCLFLPKFRLPVIVTAVLYSTAELAKGLWYLNYYSFDRAFILENLAHRIIFVIQILAAAAALT